MNFTKTISCESALAAAHALDKVIRWRQNVIESLSDNHPTTAFETDTLEMFKRLQDADIAAFKEVAGYDFEY